jgi:transposase
VQAARCVLRSGAKGSDLRNFALEHFPPGDKKVKKAVIGLARRIAVLLHKLWVNGEVYEPNYQRKRRKQQKRLFPVTAGTRVAADW